MFVSSDVGKFSIFGLFYEPALAGSGSFKRNGVGTCGKSGTELTQPEGRFVHAAFRGITASEMPLTLKPSGLSEADDYLVLEDGREIGRIYLSPGAPAGAPAWFWGNLKAPNRPGVDRGWAGDLEAAKTAFRKAWEAP